MNCGHKHNSAQDTMVIVLVLAAIIRSHGLGGLKNIYLSHSEGQKAKVKVYR